MEVGRLSRLIVYMSAIVVFLCVFGRCIDVCYLELIFTFHKNATFEL